MSHTTFTIGVDASRNRSGGALAYLENCWSQIFQETTSSHRWLYFGPSGATLKGAAFRGPFRSRGLARDLLWQHFSLPKLIRRERLDLLFTTDAASLCNWQPQVVMSQDMLAYEPGIREIYGYSRARMRIEVIRKLQVRAMRKAAAVIFLTNYARDLITRITGPLKRTEIIPHGIDRRFFVDAFAQSMARQNSDGSTRLLYIANTAPYKNHLPLIHAVARLKDQGYRLSLTLIGAIEGRTGQSVYQAIEREDPQGSYISLRGHVDNSLLPTIYCEHDICVFASSCESLPVTLLEGMAAGLPIACSNQGPMPEILRNGGVYFNPQDAVSIEETLRTLIVNREMRQHVSENAKRRAADFTWERCAKKTLALLEEVVTHRTSHHVL